MIGTKHISNKWHFTVPSDLHPGMLNVSINGWPTKREAILAGRKEFPDLPIDDEMSVLFDKGLETIHVEFDLQVSRADLNELISKYGHDVGILTDELLILLENESGWYRMGNYEVAFSTPEPGPTRNLLSRIGLYKDKNSEKIS